MGYSWNEGWTTSLSRIASALERIAEALEAPARPAGYETGTITDPLVRRATRAIDYAVGPDGGTREQSR